MSINQSPPVGAKRMSSRMYLVILVLVCALLAVWSSYAKREANKGPFWGIKEGRDLRVELLGRVGDTNKIRAEQVRARAQRFGSKQNNPMFLVDEGLQNDELVRITNTGFHTIYFEAHGAFAPIYRIETEQGGGWRMLAGSGSFSFGPSPDIS